LDIQLLIPAEALLSGATTTTSAMNIDSDRPKPAISSEANPFVKKCFICNEEGHIGRDCQWRKSQNSKNSSSYGDASDGTCYICGARGHFASECPSRDLCRVCGQAGHWGNECPQYWNKNKQKPTMGYGGGG
jgi:hypothetical protein